MIKTANGATWNPWARIIPIRCLGSTNIVWIAEALSAGVDGVILIGCKYGDDYQCHYVRGSELANTRLGNVSETLERLALEPERIKVVELSHGEFDRILIGYFAGAADGWSIASHAASRTDRLGFLLAHRPAETPVLLARDLGRCMEGIDREIVFEFAPRRNHGDGDSGRTSLPGQACS